jgi:N-acetylglucosamine-6-phosphate deacetylase
VVTSLFDIQVNGFAGVDFQDPGTTMAQARGAVDALARHQTLRFFPTFITDDIEAIEAKLRLWERFRAADPAIATAACGYHIEGPWLNPEPGYRGAHDASKMRDPEVRDLERLQAAAGGHIRLITLAPERDGSARVIRAARAMGIHISLGHSNAGEAVIAEAVAAGAKFITHLGNGVPLQLPRYDNVVQRLLACDELTAFLIPDGVHLPPFVLKNFFRAKPPGRTLFTTDCIAAAGAPPGRFRIAGIEIEVGADLAVRLPSGQLAGSALTPDRGMENTARWLGLPPEEARRLWSTAAAAHFDLPLPPLLFSH